MRKGQNLLFWRITNCQYFQTVLQNSCIPTNEPETIDESEEDVNLLYDRILQVRIKRIAEQRNLIPKHQFGFRNTHSTINQVHRITDLIERALERKNVRTAVLLDVLQAFDKVSHKGLLTKLRT